MESKEKYIFTFIAEFRGGTFCSQVKAKNVNESISKWIRKLKTKNGIQHLEIKSIEELEIELKNKDIMPILLKGLKNVWCISYSAKKGMLLINIIKTSV